MTTSGPLFRTWAVSLPSRRLPRRFIRTLTILLTSNIRHLLGCRVTVTSGCRLVRRLLGIHGRIHEGRRNNLKIMIISSNKRRVIANHQIRANGKLVRRVRLHITTRRRSRTRLLLITLKGNFRSRVQQRARPLRRLMDGLQTRVNVGINGVVRGLLGHRPKVRVTIIQRVNRRLFTLCPQLVANSHCHTHHQYRRTIGRLSRNHFPQTIQARGTGGFATFRNRVSIVRYHFLTMSLNRTTARRRFARLFRSSA